MRRNSNDQILRRKKRGGGKTDLVVEEGDIILSGGAACKVVMVLQGCSFSGGVSDAGLPPGPSGHLPSTADFGSPMHCQ